MPQPFADYRLFWRQFRQQYHTTGAVLPSGRVLAKALARYVLSGERPLRVLEVGPGTGAVTRRIVDRLGPQDTLDLVELNDQFVRRLNERFANEPRFAAAAGRTRVLHQSVESLADGEPYDVIVSGLPLNNFSVELVESILTTLSRLLSPGGTLSFFEYIAIRKAKSIVSSRAERQRLSGIGGVLHGLLARHEVRRDWVWRNVPPAWVHHVRFDGRPDGAL